MNKKYETAKKRISSSCNPTYFWRVETELLRRRRDKMDCLIFNLYQYFFGTNHQSSESEDHSKDYLNNVMMEEEWNSISTSTNSKQSIEMHPSRDEIDAFSLSENFQTQLNALRVKIQDIENKLSKDRKDDIEDKSEDTISITDQVPQCTELYQCLQNTVKELGDQKFMLDTQFKGLTLNLNNNNIRLVAVENDVKNIVIKYMGLSQMYETLQDQLEMVSGKINVRFDHLEQILRYNIAECYRTSDTLEDV